MLDVGVENIWMWMEYDEALTYWRGGPKAPSSGPFRHVGSAFLLLRRSQADTSVPIRGVECRQMEPRRGNIPAA